MLPVQKNHLRLKKKICIEKMKTQKVSLGEKIPHMYLRKKNGIFSSGCNIRWVEQALGINKILPLLPQPCS
jgi:hypothetical protein